MTAPSAETPRTTEATSRARELGHTLRRYAGVIAVFTSALGIGAVQVAQGAREWATQLGPWTVVMLLVVGFLLLDGIQQRQIAARERKEATDRETRARDAHAKTLDAIEKMVGRMADEFQDAIAGLQNTQHATATRLEGRIDALAQRLNEQTAPGRASAETRPQRPGASASTYRNFLPPVPVVPEDG